MKNSTKTQIGAAVAITAATAAAAAGAYWLYGSEHAKKNRKTARSWMLKARAEIMDAIEKIEDIDKTKFLAIAESVAREFGSKAGATSDEVAQLTKELKSVWTHVQSVHSSSKKGARKASGAKKKVKAVKKNPPAGGKKAVAKKTSGKKRA